METTFRHTKQLVGTLHVCLWTYTRTEAWAWDRPAAELAERSGSPWDDPRRRPSHADEG